MRRIYLACAFVLVIALAALVFAFPSPADASQPAAQLTLPPVATLPPILPTNPPPTSTQEPIVSLTAIQTQSDQFVAGLLTTIQQRQDIYLSANGEYWQGLPTHTNDLSYTVAVNASALANGLLLHPTDQAESWIDMYPELSTLVFPASMRIDVYDGPSGKGYVIKTRLCYVDTCYEKADNHGPETWRSSDWREEKTVIE
jgi:hypothetical protein